MKKLATKDVLRWSAKTKEAAADPLHPNGLRSGAGVAVDISGGNFQSAAFFADQFDCGRSHGLID